MLWDPPPEHPLRRMFSGYAEHTFQQNFGLADPPLIDYLSGLLCRFLHQDAIHRLKDGHGRPIEQVAEMVAEVADLPASPTRREVHRHIGDFTLFWTGLYPERLEKLRSALTKDSFIDYCEQGKRSYYIASTFADEPYTEEAPILRRLSEGYEMIAFGLNHVRREWDKGRTAGLDPSG